MADPAPGAIWAARLTKELPTLASSSDTTKQPQPQQHLPTGVTCTASDVRLEDGVCRLVFRLVRPRPDASDEGAAAVAAAAAVSIDVDVRLDREESQYPFRPPVVRVLGGGAQWLPQSLVMAEKDDGGDDDDDGARRLRLPALEEAAWTPNAGVVDLLGALMEALARGPDGDGTEEEEAGGEYGPGQVISTKAFGGTILPCTVRQQGGVVLPRYVGVADEWVLQLEADRTRLEAGVVVHAQPMLNVAKLKYRRGESLTVVFKGAYVYACLFGERMCERPSRPTDRRAWHPQHPTQPKSTIKRQTTRGGTCRWPRRGTAWRRSRRPWGSWA